MRIAVFDHQLNFGGGLRFITNLLIAIRKQHPEIQITFFCNQNKIIETDLNQVLIINKIAIGHLSVFDINKPNSSLFSRLVRYLKRNIFKINGVAFDFENALSLEISECSENFDLAYFPWPFFLKCPKTKCPKVATFHDFNFKYFFGVQIFGNEQTQFLNESINEWMKDTLPVVSTHFMERELLSFYPNVKRVNVVHLGSLNMYHDKEVNKEDHFPFKFLLDKPYFLCPVHLTVHKNIGNIIAAASLVNSNEIKFRLVFTGKFSEVISGKSSYFGLNTDEKRDKDVYGLGYVTDAEMNELLRNSFAVLNASLYEAGNGVGLDAWPLGIPVIQSNIPAFEEHINLQKFKAFSFDPRNVQSLSKAIEECLSNKIQRETNISESLAASRQLDWNIVANKYVKIFDEAIKHKNYAN